MFYFPQWLTVFVDDILIVHNNEEEYKRLEEHFAGKWKITVSTRPNKFLGININWTTLERRTEITINTRCTIENLLREQGMENANEVDTPMSSYSTKPKNEKATKNDIKKYQSIIGSLLFIARTTRPDILFATNYLARFCSGPDEEHFTMMKRIMRYLKGTKEEGIRIRPRINETKLRGFCDSDFASDPISRRSCLGYVFYWKGTPISEKSSVIRTATLSTTESECVAITEATEEAMHLKQIIQEIEAVDEGAITIFNDNQTSVTLCMHPAAHQQTKYFTTKQLFVKVSAIIN